MSIALRPTAYDHEFVEGRVVVLLQELLDAIGVVAGGSEKMTEEEHALACYLTFYRHIDACVSEIPPASKLKGKHRVVKRVMRSMLKRMKAVNVAEEFDGDGIKAETTTAFGELAIEFIETVHKVMLDNTRQYAREALARSFSE